MKKTLAKVMMIVLAVIITLSSVPVSSLTQLASGSPVAIVAQAASKKTHLNKTKKSIYVGKKYTLKLIDKKGKTISNSKIKWSRSNKTVASVSKKGVVTGKKAGKIKITATYKGKKYTSVITVKSAVSLSTSKVTFKAGETTKKTIKVTCKDDEGIKWKTIEGSGIVKLSQATKWKNDSKSLYITPTGTKFGKVKIKVYSKENSNSYDYLTIDVKKPYTLEYKTEIPCIIRNFKSEDSNTLTGDAALVIRDVSYKTPDTKTLKITVAFEASYSKDTETNYFIKYRVFDKDGYLVESNAVKSTLMMVGDKTKVEITLKNLKNGAYSIEFIDYVGTDDIITPDEDNITTDEDDITTDEALELYQKGAKDIHVRGCAGYNNVSWQRMLKLEGFGVLDTIFASILEGFMTSEEAAEVKINAKGSDDAKYRMPLSNCSKEAVKSTSVQKLLNGNYKIVIVMKEQTNPSYEDSDGLAVMSRNFLDYADVEEIVEEEQTVSKIIKSIDGEIVYKDYTITAEMTPDGKFASITHYGIGYLSATLNDSLDGTCRIEFNTKYTDFLY